MNVTEYKTPSLLLEVHENYIVAKTNPFVEISEKQLDFLVVVAKKHFNAPFGLVEVRDQNTSINPELHAKVKEVLPFLSAYALVTDSVKTVKNLYKEKTFMVYEYFKLFSDIGEATEWVDFVLSEKYQEKKIAHVE